MKGRNNGSRENIKGTIAKEEKQKVEVENKGTGSAKEENKMHDGEIEM